MDENRIREDLGSAIMLSKIILSLIFIMVISFFAQNIWQFLAIVLLVPPIVFVVFTPRNK
jgi:hypothetical protein